MKSARRKGRQGELEALELAKQLGFLNAKSDGFQFRGGDERPDLKLGEGLWCEVKNRGVTNIRAALDQAYEDRKPGDVPCALTKVRGRGPKTGKQFIFSCYFEDLPQLMATALPQIQTPF